MAEELVKQLYEMRRHLFVDPNGDVMTMTGTHCSEIDDRYFVSLIRQSNNKNIIIPIEHFMLCDETGKRLFPPLDLIKRSDEIKLDHEKIEKGKGEALEPISPRRYMTASGSSFSKLRTSVSRLETLLESEHNEPKIEEVTPGGPDDE
jgi:hypothetical protein